MVHLPKMCYRLATRLQLYGIRLPDCSKMVVWTIGLMLAFALTVKELVPLYLEYTENNVATQVKVVLMDENFKPPRMVLYFPRRKVEGEAKDFTALVDHLYNFYNGSGNLTDCVVCRKLEVASWDVWNEEQNFSEHTHDKVQFKNAITLAFVRKLFQNSTADENVLERKNWDWNRAILSAALQYFHWLGTSDYYLRSTADQAPRLSPVQDTEVYQKKLGLILNQTLTAVCEEINYTESDYSNEFEKPIHTPRTCVNLLLDVDAPVELDKMGLWFPLKTLEKPAIKQYRFVFSNRESDNGQHETWKLHTNSTNEILLYPSVDALYASTIDSGSSAYVYQTPVADQGSSQVVTVRYGVQLRAKDTRFDQLANQKTSTVALCLMECTKVWLFKKCGCASIFYRVGLEYPEGMPYCSDTIYDKCNVTALPDQIREECTQSCKATCEYIAYTWQISHSSYEFEEAGKSEFILRTLPMFDTFVELVWTTKTTPEQFFSQLTGVVNFYLGISGLSFFALVTACIDWFKRYKNLREKQTEQNNVAKPSDHLSVIGHRRSLSTNIKLEQMIYGGTMPKEDDWVTKIKKELKKELRQDMEKCLEVRMRSRKGWCAT